MKDVNNVSKVNKKPSLKKFYKTYDLWLQEGNPEGIPYTNKEGLCGAIRLYLADVPESEIEIRTGIWREFFNSLVEQGLNKIIPFNKDFGECLDEQEHGMCAYNADRILWVQRQLGK